MDGQMDGWTAGWISEETSSCPTYHLLFLFPFHVGTVTLFWPAAVLRCSELVAGPSSRGFSAAPNPGSLSWLLGTHLWPSITHCLSFLLLPFPSLSPSAALPVTQTVARRPAPPSSGSGHARQPHRTRTETPWWRRAQITPQTSLRPHQSRVCSAAAPHSPAGVAAKIPR